MLVLENKFATSTTGGHFKIINPEKLLGIINTNKIRWDSALMLTK